MIWGEESAGRSDQFEATRLDQARMIDPESTAILGVGAGAPTVDPVAGSAGKAPVRTSSGQNAWRRRLAPRHREAVKTFFGGSGSGTSNP